MVSRLCAALLLALFAAFPAQSAPTCRQALALGLDVSGSVDAGEYRLQLDGLANALLHPDVQAAVLALPSAPVSLLVYEWSGPHHQNLIVDWTALRSAADIAALAQTLRTTNRSITDVTTALGSAMLVGATHFERQRHCWKRTLDISGDGKSNTGPPPQTLRHAPQLRDITINALVIGPPMHLSGGSGPVEIGELTAYFNAYVISGTDAFVETALGFADFEAAMTRKLLRELEGLNLSALPAASIQ